MAMHTETQISPCPKCGAPNNIISGPDGEKPGPGDISLCMSCASILTFNDDMSCRPLDDEVEFLLSLSDAQRIELIGLQESVRAYILLQNSQGSSDDTGDDGKDGKASSPTLP